MTLFDNTYRAPVEPVMGQMYISNDEKPKLRVVIKAEWRCSVGPNWQIEVPEAPNALHRFMQRLIFGFKWERI